MLGGLIIITVCLCVFCIVCVKMQHELSSLITLFFETSLYRTQSLLIDKTAQPAGRAQGPSWDYSCTLSDSASYMSAGNLNSGTLFMLGKCYSTEMHPSTPAEMPSFYYASLKVS